MRETLRLVGDLSGTDTPDADRQLMCDHACIHQPFICEQGAV
jgi:hypothetical protein